jgi:hypothetical protein
LEKLHCDDEGVRRSAAAGAGKGITPCIDAGASMIRYSDVIGIVE